MPIAIATDKSVYQAGDAITVTVTADEVAPITQTATVIAKRTVDGVEERAEAEIQIEYPVSATAVSVSTVLGWEASDAPFKLTPTVTPGQYSGRVNTRL